MARETNGTDQSLQSASSLVLGGATLLSISFWLYWNAFANDDDIALESASFATGVDGDMTLSINPNSSFGRFGVIVFGTNLHNQSSFTRPSAATDHHYLITIDVTQAVNEIVAIYVDGTSQTLTRDNIGNNSGGFGSRVFHGMSRDNSSLFGAGRMSELAFWTGINLSAANATSLAGGTLPTSVESGNLVYYWKLCGVNSPELPTTGSVNMTVNGATFVAHPSAVSGSCGTTITGLGRKHQGFIYARPYL